MHFIGVPVDVPNDPFSKSFPELILHSNPAKSHQEAAEKISTQCNHAAFPWSVPNAAWIKRIDLIRSIMKPAVYSYLLHHYNTTTNTMISTNTFDNNHTIILNNYTSLDDNNNKLKSIMVPLIPNVIVKLRCMDIIRHDSQSEYGFVNFNIYTKLIPNNVTSIYILSESFDIIDDIIATKMCINIIEQLKLFLHENYNKSIILVRHGHYIDALVMLSLTSILISCPSTFSFWPGLTNEQTVYYLKSRLINTDSIDNKQLTNSFHFIQKPNKLNFGSYFHSLNSRGKAVPLTPNQKKSDDEIIIEIMKELKAEITSFE